MVQVIFSGACITSPASAAEKIENLLISVNQSGCTTDFYASKCFLSHFLLTIVQIRGIAINFWKFCWNSYWPLKCRLTGPLIVGCINCYFFAWESEIGKKLLTYPKSMINRQCEIPPSYKLNMKTREVRGFCSKILDGFFGQYFSERSLVNANFSFKFAMTS